jgi:type II secretory pathway component PulF
MSVFYYTAKTQDGQTKTGTLDTKDEESLAHTLRERGLILISGRALGEERKKKEISLINKIKGLLKRVPLADKMMFTRHLAVMRGSGQTDR